jgi:Subtilase family
MARDRDHLALPLAGQPLQRRKSGGGRAPSRDTAAHGQQLVQQAEQLAGQLTRRAAAMPRGIDPKLIFKLRLHPRGNLDEQQLGTLGLRILARDPRRAIVAFPDQATLPGMLRHLREYAGLVPGGHTYGELAAIEGIEELGPADRVGLRLAAHPLAPEELARLDLELWHSGRDESYARIAELRAFLAARNTASRDIRVTDDWVGTSICLLRVRVDQPTLDTLLSFDFVKEIDRRPEPTFEMAAVTQLGLMNITVPPIDELDDLVGVLVIDSGVMALHPLLGPALGDAQVFPDALRQRIQGGPEDGDRHDGGHGTAVAGIAVYSDVGACIEERLFVPTARLFSARVTDDQNEYDPDELLEHQLESAVRYFLDNYPAIKVINISLGDAAAIYADGLYQFHFAAAIDDLAYGYRDREVLFVVSAGNFTFAAMTAEEILAGYPSYLLQRPDARIIDPATAALAMTVGGLSYGAGRDRGGKYLIGTETLVAGERGWPAPFTRTGWGVDGAIKPDVVDFAGDTAFERGRIRREPTYAGLPTTARAFVPPASELFRTVAGTSFAAPRVANLAAQIFRERPDASANLVRALIAASARIPETRPAALAGKQPWDEDILRVYGYGQPDFERATRSSQHEVLLLADDTIAIDSFLLFSVPSLPAAFFTAKGHGYIAVTLAFDPITRHTRGDSYLGVTMQFAAYRNVTAEQVADALRDWGDEKDNLEEDVPSLQRLRKAGDPPVTIGLKPGTKRRQKGTLQHALCPISGASWQYDFQDCVLAVICQRKWAPLTIERQRFALVVSIFHDNPAVDIYTHVLQRTAIYQRARARIGT